MFINVQHPGENTLQANLTDPPKYTSHCPSNAGYGADKRPRSATIVITENDGGSIGTRHDRRIKGAKGTRLEPVARSLQRTPGFSLSEQK